MEANLKADPAQPRGGRHFVLDEAEKLAWIRLIRTENIGPVTFHELIGHFGSAVCALEALPELSRRGGTRHARRPYPEDLARREWEAADRIGARIIAFGESGYPPLLKQIAGAPPLLFVKGRVELAARPTVAIVGSRNASAAGRQFAATLARDLGSADVVVASGLARGIDAAAHEAALASGTAGVVAGGIDIVYPPENAALYEAIAEHGLLMSECPPGFAPRGQDFPRRNRIISGVSSGVVIVEAAQKSGSLITARMALEQNREVFAVPGHPLDPRTLGTNGLIKSGAHLTTGADDILAELFGGVRCGLHWREPANAFEPPPRRPEREAFEASETDRQTLLDLLGFAPVHPNVLMRQSGLTPGRLAIALLELDLAGRIYRREDETVSLKATGFDIGQD